MPANLRCQECNQEFEAKRSDAKYCRKCYKEMRRAYLHEYDHRKRRDACPECGAPKGKRAQFCRPCNNKHQPWRKVGKDNSNWKGGWTISTDGYVYRRVSPEPTTTGRAYKAEHRLIWEQAHGPIPKGWVVHHLNGDKADNCLENLAAMPRTAHNPSLIVAPYRKRIRNLERQLKLLENKREGN